MAAAPAAAAAAAAAAVTTAVSRAGAGAPSAAAQHSQQLAAASHVCVLLLWVWSALSEALLALAASLASLGSRTAAATTGATSSLLLLRHVHVHITTRQLAALLWRRSAGSALPPSPVAAPASAAAAVRLPSCLPPQLPCHRGRLTVVLDLDETLLVAYRLVQHGRDGLSLVPACWPASSASSGSSSGGSGTRLRRRTLGGGSSGGGSSGGSSGSSYTVTASAAPPPHVVGAAGLCSCPLGAPSAWLTYAPPSGCGAATTLAVYERPGVRPFLAGVAAFAELVLFTAGSADYAAPLAAHLDPGGRLFSGRLYGDATVVVGGRRGVKDLAALQRDLARVVLVDNSVYSFLLQPHNGLPCAPFRGGGSDGVLLGVILPLLRCLADTADVRVLLAGQFRVAEWLASKGHRLPAGV